MLEADIDPSELIHHGLGQNRHERWVFTDLELTNPKACRGHDIFLAFPRYQRMYRQPDTGGRGVRVWRDGTVSSTWEDGGEDVVPNAIKRLADKEEVYVTLDRATQAWNWRDVLTDNTGEFIRFATPEDMAAVTYPPQ